MNHVLQTETLAIFQALKPNDVLVLYQHRTNHSGQPWIDPKRQELVRALGVAASAVKVAWGPKIANDVAFYYVQRA